MYLYSPRYWWHQDVSGALFWCWIAVYIQQQKCALQSSTENRLHRSDNPINTCNIPAVLTYLWSLQPLHIIPVMTVSQCTLFVSTSRSPCEYSISCKWSKSKFNKGTSRAAIPELLSEIVLLCALFCRHLQSKHLFPSAVNGKIRIYTSIHTIYMSRRTRKFWSLSRSGRRG